MFCSARTLGGVLSAAVVCLAQWLAAGQATDHSFRDNKGTEFVLSFIENFQRAGHQPQLLITGAGLAPAAVVVDVPAVGFTSVVNVRLGEVVAVTLPREGVEMRGSKRGNNGIFIKGNGDIVVYGVFTERDSSDGYLGLPVDVLGTEYLVPCNTVTSDRPEEGFTHIPSEFGLVGVYDNTTVNIVPTQPVLFEDQSYSAKQTITVRLNRLETLQVQSRGDLTGSRITSDKPVAVLSGNLFTQVGAHPDGKVGSGTHIVEMIPPVDCWGTQFGLVPLKERTRGDIFRVLAAKADTQVNLTGNNPRILHSGEFWEFSLSSYLYKHLITSEPVLVVQYSKSKTVDQARADPFMMLIPCVSQFDNNYSFSTVDFAVLRLVGTYHLNVVIRTAEKDGLRLDDNALGPMVQWAVIPGTDLSAARIDVGCGSHTLLHGSPAVTFGVSVYGFTDWDGYGFPGGLRLATPSWWLNNGGADRYVDKTVLKGIQHLDNRKANRNIVPTELPTETLQWKDYTESKVLIVGFCAVLLVLIIAGVLKIRTKCEETISSNSMEALELEESSSEQ